MRKSLDVKPYVYPQPVFIIGSYDENGVADAMNAAWGSVADYDKLAIYLAAAHKSVKNILKTKALTVSMATVDQVVACDYVGIASGNKDPKKIDKTGWHISKSEVVLAPIFEELPLTFECGLESYDSESELMIAKIVGVSCDKSILDDDGKIDPSKLNPIIFDSVHQRYLALGKKVGNAFSDGKKLF